MIAGFEGRPGPPNRVSTSDMQRPEDQAPPPRPAWKFPLRRVFLWASIASLVMWAVLLALIFTGHTKIIWTAEKAVGLTTKAIHKVHHKIGEAQGDRDLTLHTH